MSGVAPRAFVHRGHLPAEGFVLNPQLLGEAACRARILGLWQDGASLRRAHDLYVLLLPRPVPCRAEQAPGVPLVRVGDRLCSTRLQNDELEALAPEADLILVRHGRVVGAELRQLESVDPAQWLDLHDWQITEVRPLGGLPPPPAPPPPKPSAQLRDHIPQLPPVQEQARLLQARLRGEETGPPSDAGSPRLFGKVVSVLRALRDRLADGNRRPAGRATGGGTGAGRAAGGAPTRSPPWARLGRWLSAWWNRALLGTRIAQLFGRRQARYLAELMRMFDQGDLEQALRHAVPLGGEGEGNPSLGISLPKARDDLQLSMQSGASDGPTLYVHSQVMEMLRARYQMAFERLLSQGRIEEAAFVLADLLHDSDEAVSFLESHGRLRLAAELADARELPPARRVRQWMLAGETERAVEIAKRHRAFSTALGLLQAKHAASAQLLRIKWAEALAEQGAFEAAVTTIWSIESARGLAFPWIEAGMLLGGPPAAGLLIRAVGLMPERFELWLKHARTIWVDAGHQSVETRKALASAVIAAPETAHTELLAKGTARALFVDSARGHSVPADSLRELVRKSKDGALKTDWPGPGRAPPRPAPGSLEVRLSDHDVGSVAIYDAVNLSKGRTLLALGEGGMRLITADGRTIAHFAQPAHRLVISDHGHRALALAHRGRWTKVTHVDLVHRRATPWTDLEVGPYCETFDGWTWFVALQGKLTGIDLSTTPARQTYCNSDCHPISLARDADGLRVHHRGPADQQVWQFDLPSLTLRARTPFTFPEGQLTVGPVNAAGQVPFEQAPKPPGAAESVGRRGALGQPPHQNHPFVRSSERVTALIQAGPHTIRAYTASTAGGVRALKTAGGECEVHLALLGAREVRARVHDGQLLVFDARGRLLIVDLERRELHTSLRVRG